MTRGSHEGREDGARSFVSFVSPAIVLRGNDLFMLIGGPGGSRIPTAVLQVFLNVVDFGMNRRKRWTRRASIISGCPTPFRSSAASHPMRSPCFARAVTKCAKRRAPWRPSWNCWSRMAGGCRARLTSAGSAAHPDTDIAVGVCGRPRHSCRGGTGDSRQSIDIFPNKIEGSRIFYSVVTVALSLDTR